MKRSGDELNLSEGERGSKNRKTLNFALAYRDGIEGNGSSSSSIGDVSVSETTREKLKRKLLQKKDCKDDGTEILESWLREILAASLVGEILDLNLNIMLQISNNILCNLLYKTRCVTGKFSIGSQKKYISAFLHQNSKSLQKTCYIAVRIFYFPFDL